MADSNQFLYKPTSDTTGNLVILTPSAWNNNIDSVDLVDSQGNVIESGQYSSRANGNRNHFRFSKPGASYGQGNSVRITYSDGTEATNIQIQDPGARYQQDITSTVPNQVDYGSINPAQVDLNAALDLANQYGQQAADLYYTNLDRGGEAAQGIIGADIRGIQQGLDILGNRSRTEGRQDLRENIARAGEIDKFNFSRLEGINSFNRQLAEQSNEFNMDQQRRAEESTGLGYRGRINDLLDRLDARSRTGRMGSEFDAAMDTATAARASDLAGASGVSAISGAGVRARDRMMINERLQLALGAEAALPQILQTAQQTLQYQPERAPTAYAAPTQVPLNPASVEARMPITSSISAGQAAMSIAGTATNLQAIPAQTALSASLSTQQFNEQARYNQQVLAADRQQDYNNMTAQIGQGVVNQRYAEQLRQDQMDAYQEGLDVRRQSDIIGGVSSVVGAVGQAVLAPSGQVAARPTATTSGGAAAPSAPAPQAGGQPTAQPQQSGWDEFINDPVGFATPTPMGGKSTRPVVASMGGSAQRSVSPTGISATGNAVIDAALNNPTNYSGLVSNTSSFVKDAMTKSLGKGPARIGNTEIPEALYKQALQDSDNFFSGSTSDFSTSETGFMTKQDAAVAKSRAAGATTKDIKADGTEAGGLLSQIRETAGEARNIFQQVTKPVTDLGIDQTLISQGTDMFQNWEAMSPERRMTQAGSMSVTMLQNHGVLNSEEATETQRSIEAINTLIDPNSTDAQRATAIGIATADLATTSFTGDIGNPTTIGGQGVRGSVQMDDGNIGFQLDDGSVVAQSTLRNTARVMAGAGALQVLASDADDDKKVRSLVSLGISEARAEDILSQTQAGNWAAGLSIIDTAMDWADMSYFQRANSLIQTSHAVMNSSYGMAVGDTAAEVGGSILEWGGATASSVEMPSLAVASGALQAVGGALAVGMGIDQAADVFSAVDDMPQSRAVGAAAGGLASSGAMIGGGLAGMTAGIAAATGTLAGATVLGTSIGTAAFPVIGTAIGAAVGVTAGLIAGNTGTGKNTGQLMRDGWRGAMRDSGFASKNKQGDTTVTLADGSEYNIGLDGGGKLVNKDGSERNSFDIDWGNQVAADSIPAAHLAAIATGLDPTGAESHDLFNRATGQLVNAATSNADTVEGARANYKAIMDKAGVDPRQLGMRIETLRATNKITDQEYGVYLDQINQMYGTKLQPTDIDASRNNLVAMVRNKPQDQLNSFDKNLLADLTDSNRISASEKALQKRLGKNKSAQEGKKYVSARQYGVLSALGKNTDNLYMGA